MTEKKVLNNVSCIDKDECSGCGACKWVCPTKCIEMIMDDEGFLYPYIVEEKCESCGKCVNVCRYSIEGKKVVLKALMGWSKDTHVRCNSSSGGIFYEISKHVILNGGVVYGAEYNDQFKAIHIRVDSIEDLPRLIGSKYMQSDLQHIFEQIKSDVDHDRIVLFSGTPCQTNIVRSMFSSDLLTCISVVCHGVPSAEVWSRYLAHIQKECGEKTIKKVNFRNKNKGWNDYSLKIDFDHEYYINHHRTDIFMSGFLDNLFLRTSCYKCLHKRNDCADITLGDFWGVEKHYAEIDTTNGVSGIIVRTENGKKMLEGISMSVSVRETEYSYIFENNNSLEESAPKNNGRKYFFEDFKRNIPIDYAIKTNLSTKKRVDSMGFHLLDRWMTCIRKGKTIETFFCDNNYKTIAIYGMGIIGRQIVAELTMTSVDVKYGIDRNSDKISIDSIVMLSLPEIVNMTEVDAIVVTPVQMYGEIEKVLWYYGRQEDILSFEYIVHYIESK